MGINGDMTNLGACTGYTCHSKCSHEYRPPVGDLSINNINRMLTLFYYYTKYQYVLKKNYQGIE